MKLTVELDVRREDGMEEAGAEALASALVQQTEAMVVDVDGNKYAVHNAKVVSAVA